MTTHNPVLGDIELRKKLGLDSANKKRRTRRKRLAVALPLIGVLIALGVWRAGGPGDQPNYVTQPVRRGDLAVMVTATGSLDARETIDVGAEVSGRILRVHVDFNDPVRKGQLLAELDTEELEARVREARARVRAAKATERVARATSNEAKQAADRAERLAEKGLISVARLETALAAAERARADVGARSAQTAVAAAALSDARTRIGRARITSPIDGIVLERNVEAGQTLASEFQVPVLFRIARDLSRMELSVAVDEADVGRVKEGQQATFSVEAYPDRTFRSTVRSLRNVPTIEQTVVTYVAVLAVDNDEHMLRPGMTATATIVTETIEDVLLIPNSALRFTPPSEVTDKENEPRKAKAIGDEAPKHKVWMLEGDNPKAIEVNVGPTDGTHAELLEGALASGTELLVDLHEDEEP